MLLEIQLNVYIKGTDIVNVYNGGVWGHDFWCPISDTWKELQRELEVLDGVPGRAFAVAAII